jgi:hypothetical protein
MIKVNRQTPAASGSLAEEGIGRAAVPEGTERNRGDSMIQRDNPSTDGAGVQPTCGPACLPAPAPPVMFAASASPSFWEQWYDQADADQRQQVIELAAQQGVLCSAQLPATEAPSRQQPLAELLADPSVRARLEPFEPAALDTADPELDPAQRLAVARALATPDLALIQGHPGTGKTRVVAELLRQADRHGLRVLFVAPTAAAVDRALERVAADPSVRVLRLLVGDEPADSVPACTHRLSLPGRLRLFAEQTLPAARRAVDEVRAAHDARAKDEQAWLRLEESLAQKERATAELAALEAAPLAEAAAAEQAERSQAWQTFSASYEDSARKLDERAAVAHRELERVGAELKKCSDGLKDLTPLAEAKQAGRWWTGSYWRAALHGDVRPRVEELQGRCKQTADQHEAAQREADAVAAQRRDLDAGRDAQRKRLIEEQTARLRAQREEQAASLRRQIDEADAAWQAGCSALYADVPRPESAGRDALEKARAGWRDLQARDQTESVQRTLWLRSLEQTQPGLSAHLAASARIVAAPLAAVPTDAAGFDLLIVEEADRLSDAELTGLARRAARSVLVGEPPLNLPLSLRRGSPRDRAAPRPPFARLWQTLHADPRRLEPRWWLAGDRLVARLRHYTPDEERWLQREPVFDRPEIELGIVSPPRQEPRIVEVSFPACTPPEQARAFLFGELDELAVQAAGPAMAWGEQEQTVTLAFAPPREPSLTAAFPNGIRERLIRCDRAEAETEWLTGALEFDRAAGWDLARARDWVAQRLGLLDVGRSVALTRSYRAQPALAQALGEMLWGEPGRPTPDRPAVEFVPVPAMNDQRPDPRRPAEPDLRRGGTATLAARSRQTRGAGVEIELADLPAGDPRGVRRNDVLPADLRAALPATGLINLVEARAMLAALEDLVSDPAFQAASAAWQQKPALDCLSASGACEAHGPVANPSVAVMSLFPAQVALLSQLVGRSRVLAASRAPVKVCHPAELHQGECLVAYLGLTRSHTHRAVPFSDCPESLVRAMTRPAARLVLFGDVGTLARRSQWHGALDHLDELAGSTEQALIGRLLGGVIEPGAPEPDRGAWAGRSRESSGV